MGLHHIVDYKLTPFIPDFIPAVGDIDAFIKVLCLFTMPNHSDIQYVNQLFNII
jgi:hypothetical protein